jgi:hypothetical protein
MVPTNYRRPYLVAGALGQHYGATNMALLRKRNLFSRRREGPIFKQINGHGTTALARTSIDLPDDGRESENVGEGQLLTEGPN